MNWLTGLQTKGWLMIVGALLASMATLGVLNYARGIKITVLEADLRSCRADVEVEQSKVKACIADVRTWEGKVNEQNAAIQKIKAEAAVRASESLRLLAEARRMAMRAEARANELQARLDAPTPPGADAATAVAEVRSGLDLQ